MNNLINDNGVVQFALYNRQVDFPDESFKKCYLIRKEAIHNRTSSVTFKGLTAGNYAVNVLHDENNDGKINKTLFLPNEGVGFSNYDKIRIGNKPNFKEASFLLKGDKNIIIKMIYLLLK